MSVTEAERHHLYEVVKSHFGAASADTLMNLIPPSDWSQFATASDIDRLSSQIGRVEVELGSRIDRVEVELGSRIDRVETELGSRIDRVESMLMVMATKDEIRADLLQVRDDLTRTFGTWLFASQAAVITMIAALGALIAVLI